MPSKLQSILLGGIALGVANVLLARVPYVGGCIVCLCYIGAGWLAVWHYTTTYELTITGGAGAGMGALTGVVAALVAGVLGYLLIALNIFPGPEEMLQQMAESGTFDQMDSSTEDMIRSWTTSMFGVVGMLVGAVLGAILGLVGGIIGAAQFKKGDEPAAAM